MVTRSVPGTQSIARAIAVAKAVAEHKQIGWRLTDLAARCGLEKSTAYRILNSLVAERFVIKRATDRRYVPGPLMFELALCTPGYAAFVAVVHPLLTRIADGGVSAYLYLRSGPEAVCVDDVRTTAGQPLTTRGRRLPLAQSTFGIAMILALPRDQQQELLALTESPATAPNKNAVAYRKVLALSRSSGYAINAGIVVPGLTSIAVAVLDHRQRPFAAIGIGAPSAAMRGAKLERMVDTLRHESRQIGENHADLISEAGL